MCFVDFEYAGWDDPAKMVADFFLQPEVPVDQKFFDSFLQETVKGPQAELQKSRIDILCPVFAVKWCCIIMNPFVRERAQAGHYANPTRDETERKRTQVKKAKAAFDALKKGKGNGVR